MKTWETHITELESRQISKSGRHSLRLIHPKVLLFAIRSTRQVTPANDIGMLRVGFSVGITSQSYFEHCFSETNTATDSGFWCVSIKVYCANVPDFGFTQTLRAAYRRFEPIGLGIAPRHQTRRTNRPRLFYHIIGPIYKAA